MKYPEDKVDKDADAVSLLERAGLDGTFLVSMFDALQDGVLVTDAQGTIRTVNQAALDLFCYTAAPLLGQHISLLMPHPATFSAADHQGQFWCTQGSGYELTGRCRGGEYLVLRVSVGEFIWQQQRMFVSICHDITEQRRHTEHIAFLASHDSLTGCPNREQFLHALNQALQERRNVAHSLAVLFIDLDGFKAVNDKHGHRLGDLLLKRVAERLRRRLRDHDLLSRIGGDEFVVLVHLDGDAELAQRVAARLITSLQQPFSMGDLALRVTASIGISLLTGQQEADDLLDEADIAMYQAKLDGGNSVRVFSEALLERTERIHRELTALRRAVAKQQLELHYQLQFDMRSLQPSGIQALLRWRSEHGLIMPERFMPMAETHGLASDIERWALKQACRDKARLVADGLLDSRVTVRVGSALLRAPDFVPWVQELLRKNSLAPRHLELEVTEEAAIDTHTHARQSLLALTGAGVSLGLGGFGASHASLGRLKALPTSTLKIDRLFTAGLPDSIEDRAIIRAVVEIAAVLGMRTLAEGVESKAQMACLQEQGCMLGQGGWYARPMRLPELSQWLEKID